MALSSVLTFGDNDKWWGSIVVKGEGQLPPKASDIYFTWRWLRKKSSAK